MAKIGKPHGFVPRVSRGKGKGLTSQTLTKPGPVEPGHRLVPVSVWPGHGLVCGKLGFHTGPDLAYSK